jgi:hypothetical protein
VDGSSGLGFTGETVCSPGKNKTKTERGKERNEKRIFAEEHEKEQLTGRKEVKQSICVRCVDKCGNG